MNLLGNLFDFWRSVLLPAPSDDMTALAEAVGVLNDPIPLVPADHETTPTHDALWAEVVEDNAATFMHEHGLTDPVGFCEVMADWLRMKSEVES